MNCRWLGQSSDDTEQSAPRLLFFAHQRTGRMKTRNPFNHMSVAFRRNLALKLGGYPKIELREDYGLWASMLASGAKSKNIKDILVHASAGNKMFKRRKGGAIINAEITLQSHLVKTNMSSLHEAILFGFLRIMSFKLPKSLIKIIYVNILRR